MLAVLESFPFIPSQQNLDNLSTFLTPVQTSTQAETASKARLLAELQHDVQWVQQHIPTQGHMSSLCQSANSMAPVSS